MEDHAPDFNFEILNSRVLRSRITEKIGAKAGLSIHALIESLFEVGDAYFIAAIGLWLV